MNTQSLRSSFILHRSSFVLIAIFATIPFLPALVSGHVFSLRDHFDYFQPLRWFTATELQEGRLPLWNPYSASGEPWLANPQTGVFYPPQWLHVVLPFATAYVLYLLFHMLVLGWGAYLFFGRDASPGAAMIGAAALMFSGPVLSLLDVSNNFATFAWIPLALWCAAEGAWRRGGVVLALAFLAGEPFFAAVGAVLYAIVLTMSQRRARLQPASPVLPVARGPLPGHSVLAELPGSRVTGHGQRSGRVEATPYVVIYSAFLAFGLSAIQLLPFLAFIRTSDRAGGTDPAAVLAHSMPLRDWLRVAVPGASTEQQFIPVVYVGVLVLVLMLLGIRRRTLPWLALLGVAIAISTGPAFLAQLPLTLFRYPARLVPLGALAIVALAVAGWERVRPNRRWADLIVVALVLADLAPRVWPLLRTAPFRRDVVPWAADVGAERKIVRVGAIDPAKRTPWIAGYLNLYDRRFDEFTPAPAVSGRYVQRHQQLLNSPRRYELAKRGVAWVLTSNHLRTFTLVEERDGVKLYRNAATLPMAALMMRGPDTLLPLEARLTTSRASVTVDAPREGAIVLLQQDAPGWRVFIDGLEARAFAFDGLFRGVQVTQGRHEIVWTYHVPGLFVGAALTCFSLIALVIFLFVKRTR